MDLKSTSPLWVIVALLIVAIVLLFRISSQLEKIYKTTSDIYSNNPAGSILDLLKCYEGDCAMVNVVR